MKTILLAVFLQLFTTALWSQTTYYWVAGTTVNAGFEQSSSWNTTLGGGGAARTTPADNDILIFDGNNYGSTSASSATVYGIPAQTIGKLILRNNANVTFASAATARTVALGGTISKSGTTITGNAATSFTIDFKVGDLLASSQWGATLSLITAVNASTLTTAETASFGNTNYYKAAALRITAQEGLLIERGSVLNITASNAPFAISVLAGASGIVRGSIAFQPSGASQACRLIAAGAEGVIIDSAGIITNGPNCRGNLFGTNAVSTDNNIVFAKGSRYNHSPWNASASENQMPFGNNVTPPHSVVDFREGSTIAYNTAKGAAFTNFKLSNVIFNTNATITGSPAAMGSLTISSGYTVINNSPNPFPISGNITNNGTFSTAAASTIILCGTAPQSVSGTGNYFLNNLITADGSNVSLNKSITMLSASDFDSAGAVVVNGAQVVAASEGVNVGLTTNVFLEGAGTPRTTPFATAIRKMKISTLRFGEGEMGDWYLWSKPPYTNPDPHAAMWGGSKWPFSDGGIFNLPAANGDITSNHMNLGQFLTLCKDSAITPYIIVPIDAIMQPDAVDHYVSKQQILDNAVSMVRYVKQQGLPAVYYEIGNENYYPISGTNSNQTWTATNYANLVVELSDLMKAEDSTILIGMDGHNYPNTKWFDTLFMIAAKKADFLVAHNYLPNLSSVSTAAGSWYNSYLSMTASNSSLARSLAIVNNALESLGDASDKARYKIAVTETGPYSPGTADSIYSQTNTMGKAIIAADMLGEILSNPRVAHMHVWTSHWHLSNAQTNNQPFNLRNMLGGNNQMTPVGYAMQLVNECITGNKVAVTDISGATKYKLHAFYNPATGNANLLVINRDSTSKTIPVKFNNMNMQNKTTLEVWQVKGTNPDDYSPVTGALTNISTDAEGRMSVTVPAYSVIRYSF